jgi:hypothetical protein
MTLAGTTLAERERAFLRIVRYSGLLPGEGPLLLSLIVWPEGIPDFIMKELVPGRR